MKVKNRRGIVLNVPDDWTDEILLEKSLVAIQESLPSKKSRNLSAESDYKSMTLQKLKTLAHKRNLKVGRSGKERIAQILEESDA